VNVLAGLFLIAHGLVHVAIWVPEPQEGAPFNPRRSWLLGDAGGLTRTLALVACGLLVLAGVFLLNGASDLDAGLAIAGAAVSLVLVALTFHLWFVGAVAINIAIIVVALA
jgi:hypothetical protein